MALAPMIGAFQWGRGGQAMTPDQIAREREVAQSLAAQAMDTSPIGHWSQGVNRVLQGLMAGYDMRTADKAESDNLEYSGGLRQRIIESLGGGTNPVIPASMASGESLDPATARVAAAFANQGDMSAYRDAIASIESAGSGDYGAIGPTHDTMGRALGRYQVMEANVGPWSQAALGRAVTPDEFLTSPQIQDSVFDHQFGGYVDKFGDPALAAQAWFAGPGGVGTSRQDSLGTSVPEYAQKFNAALGGPAAQALSPRGAQVAQTGGINPAILEALTDPRVDDQTRNLAGILFGQQMKANDPSAQLDMDYKRAQIAKMQRDAANLNGDESFFGNPVAIQNPDGSVGYGQLGNKGTFRPVQLGEGQTFAPPTRTINTGTENILVDQAGNVISRVPIENRQAAADTAAGTVEGRTQAEQAAAASGDLQAGQNALDILDQIEEHAGIDSGTGLWSYGNAIRGTPGYDFQNLVEQAKSGAFLSAIQQMRGMGALSNAEGAAATAAVTRMDTATSKDAFLAAVRDYRKIVQQGIEKARGRMGESAPQSDAPTAPSKRLRFNPETGELE